MHDFKPHSFLLLFLITSSLINLCLSTGRVNSDKTEECNANNCALPLCKCSDTEPPGNMPLEEIPMMVGITFNGVVSSRHMKYFKQILNPIFKNPNGCPPQATFFVSDKSETANTDYCVVQNLFHNNNEIAVGAEKYNCPYTDCDSMGKHFRKWKADSAEKTIYQQKKKIARMAKINRSFLRGFRLPKLSQDGNVHFGAIKKYAFNYDSSAIVSQEDIIKNKGNMRYWPHTLDFPPTYECGTCATKRSFCREKDNCTMNSVWVVPLHTLGVEGQNACPLLIKDEISQNRLANKNCIPRHKLTMEIFKKTLFQNFDRHYKLNKAPFIINIETEWLDEFGEILTEALKTFINDLTDDQNKYSRNSDIYFLSISNMLEWIQYPASKQKIASQWLWDCDDSSYDYDEECQSVLKIQEQLAELEEERKLNKTIELDRQAERLFHNGVLTVTMVGFVVLTALTVFYDKFG